MLIHFTGSLDNILKILRNNFIPYYSMEKILNGRMEVAIPMVSFCDIPLSLIEEHRKVYGDYAIGLSKEWGIRNKLNPIFYYVENSILDKCVSDIITNIAFASSKNQGGVKPNDAVVLKKLFPYFYYSKPYMGSNWNKISKEFDQEQRILYNEREWRYTLEEEPSPRVNFIFKETFLDDEKLKKLNNYMETKKLAFTPNDIKYLIIKDEHEISYLIAEINKIKSDFNEEQRKVLSSRIMTIKQILEDF